MGLRHETLRLASRGAARLRRLASAAIRGKPTEEGPGGAGHDDAARRSARYWTRHTVTSNEQFTSPEASLEHFHWRVAQYHDHIELMPVRGHDGEVVLDLGCGPGNDLVGLGVFSRPSRLLGADVSTTALELARARTALHGLEVELSLLSPDSPALPYADASVDYVHCSGVLHHLEDEAATLRECRRVLRPGGHLRVMVYNYDSVWLHLYVAYVKQKVEGAYADLDIQSAFARTTDGPSCPISRAYRPDSFLGIARTAGFEATFLGASVSMWEMKLLPRRFDAIMDRRLAPEHRDFLRELEVDRRGYPVRRGHHAGIDACFLLRPA